MLHSHDTSELCDVTPCDFFLGEHLKANVFSTPAPDLLMLKSLIQAEISKIRKKMLQKVNENALSCFRIRTGNDGHHLPKSYSQIKFTSRKMTYFSLFIGALFHIVRFFVLQLY